MEIIKTRQKIYSGYSIVSGKSKSVLVFLMLMSFSLMSAVAQTTSFTYQGKLNDGGIPASAAYDMQFKLFDAPSAGIQVGATQMKTNVPTSGGVFTVELDFGATVFNGTDRFIEIGISPAGQNNFVTLAPRQKLNAAPYSVQSLQAATAANALRLGNITANQYVLTNDPRLDANNFVQNSTTPQATANFNIGGTGTANILNAATQFNLGGNRILSATGNGNLFAGFSAGSANTNGTNNSFFGVQAGNANTTGFQNSFFGTQAGLNNTTGSSNSFFGRSAGLSNMTGSGNSFFGQDAGISSTTGNFNSFFGLLAGDSNSTGSDNSFFGVQAGQGNTTGQYNSFYGRSAGFFNTVGGNNSFFGTDAGQTNTTGAANTFIGRTAGINNTTGNNNTFIGASTGNSNAATQVSNSTAIGFGARVSASHTIAIGTSSETTLLSGGIGKTFNVSNVFYGMIANNLIWRELNGDIPTSDFPVCFRLMNIGGDGGYGLTNCFSNFSPAADKSEIEPFTGGFDVINRLNPVSFKRKQDGKSGIGLNADEVAEVAPQLVTRNDKDEVEDIKTTSLNAVFINAFKEQQKQIEAQQRQINALKKLVCQSNPQADVCKEEK